MKKISFIFIFFLFSSSLLADDNKKEIDKLFVQLKSALNFENSKKIEDKIWDLWTTHPTKNNLTKLLADGSSAMMDNKLDAAYDKFTEVIELDPNWAEAWNKRATVFYLIGEYEKSQNDIDKVLDLEKRHFGALAGQGLVNIKLQNFEKAIKSYEEAMKIYPSMNSGKIMIKRIKELIKEQST